MVFPITPLDRIFVVSVEVILDIARHEGRICTKGRVLARSGNPRRYLEQAMQHLAGWGIVHSRRGTGGGYAIGRDPSKITLADIFLALAQNKDRVERERATAPLFVIAADCLDGLASKWQKDLEAITIQHLREREQENNRIR